MTTLTFGQLAPIVTQACRHFRVDLWDTPTVENTAARVLVAIGYHREDAVTNAKTLALIVYEAPHVSVSA